MLAVPLRTPEEVTSFFDMLKAGALSNLAEGRPVAARRESDLEPVLDEAGAAVEMVYRGRTYTVAFDRPAAKMLGDA